MIFDVKQLRDYDASEKRRRLVAASRREEIGSG
jgi:hypothetical protein